MPIDRLVLVSLTAGVLLAAVSGCFEIGKYVVQHSLGARLSSCQASKDSVQAVRGKPYWRYFSDTEDVSEGTQLFRHEWAYRIQRDSAGVIPDSVVVVGFRWGDGLDRCDVQERRAKALSHPSVPWEGAGDVPRLPF